MICVYWGSRRSLRPPRHSARVLQAGNASITKVKTYPHWNKVADENCKRRTIGVRRKVLLRPESLVTGPRSIGNNWTSNVFPKIDMCIFQ